MAGKIPNYTFEVLRPPIKKEVGEGLIKLLSHLEEPFQTDIRSCLYEREGNTSGIFVVCRNGSGKEVSNVHVSWNAKQAEGVRVGLLGRVVTAEAYRGRGLATQVLQLAITEFYGPGIRGSCLVLVVEEAMPRRIYLRAGFRDIMGSLEFNAVVMLHSKHSLEPREYLESYFKPCGEITSEVTTRRHSAAVVLLLSSFPTKEVNLNDIIKMCYKFDTELETLELMKSIEEGRVTSSVYLSGDRVVGLEIANQGERRTINHTNFNECEHKYKQPLM